MSSFDPVSSLRSLPAHPRLFASPARWEALRGQVETDPISSRIFFHLKSRADHFLDAPPTTYQVEGRRLLAVSRRCLECVSTLAAVARVTGDGRYAGRALEELRAISEFPDWSPLHFLDAAEMALAVAIGYDWLYDHLTAEDRELIGRALIEKGLRPSFDGPAEQLWWVAGGNNWNQVCHGGMVAAALAVAERDPELCGRAVQRAIENLHHSAATYAPDGAYPEGPTYWDYGTTFHLVLVSALEAVFGRTFGLDAFPGFRESADYMMQVTTPTGVFFNYADSREDRFFSVPLFWFAGKLGRPELVRSEIESLGKTPEALVKSDNNTNFRLLALTLFWWNPGAAGAKSAPPLHWLARGETPVAVHRSAWDDRRTVFIGIKGGAPVSSHAHMDVGSFIMEAGGVRWAVDTGMQEYHSLESHGLALWCYEQGRDRWRIFRIGPESHNIPRFNGAEQLVTGRAELVSFRPDGPAPHTIFDLTTLYRDQVASARRGVSLLPNGQVLIQDEWTADDKPVDVSWQWLTRAEVETEPRAVVLRQAGETLRLQLLGPDDARVEVEDVSRPARPHDVENPGLKRLVVRALTPAKAAGCICVLAVPDSVRKPGSRPVIPLRDWLAAF